MSKNAMLYNLGKKLFKIIFRFAHITMNPFIGKWFYKRLYDDADDGIVIPINKSIAETENIVLPSEIVRHFIKTTDHRFIMDKCICRTVEKCKKYPIDLGCIFLGEAAKNISPKLGRMASVDEAMEHLERCESAGLVHQIGRFKFDSILLNAKPPNKLLSICNCCECCCIFRLTPNIYKPMGETLKRLEGVNVLVNDNCTGCGLCSEVCIFSAIFLDNKKSCISDMCRGCGRCFRTCKNNAIIVTIDKSDFLTSSIERISNIVEV